MSCLMRWDWLLVQPPRYLSARRLTISYPGAARLVTAYMIWAMLGLLKAANTKVLISMDQYLAQRSDES